MARDESDTLTANPPTTLQLDIQCPVVGFDIHLLGSVEILFFRHIII